MDLSNFNAAEQAHMTKVIEKKQVGELKFYKALLIMVVSFRCKIS
jgi:hypothetical protein